MPESPNLPQDSSTIVKSPTLATAKQPVHLRKFLGSDIFILGGVFAILCQFANPKIAIGSYKQSSFNNRFIARLTNTYRYLNVVVFGTLEEQQAITSVINRLHSRVKSPDYDADDPELHKWTAATVFMAFLLVQETFIGKLSLAEKEVILQEFAATGSALRMRLDMWPKSLEEFQLYWDSNISDLEVTEEARIMAGQFLYPVKMPLPLRMFLPLTRLITTNFLPPRLAREYDLEPSTGGKLLFSAVGWMIWLTYALLPDSITTFIHRYFMRDLRNAVEMIQQTGHWDRKRITDEEFCRQLFNTQQILTFIRR